MTSPLRRVLELANRIQGPILAFDRHPEGGVRPAFPMDAVQEASDRLQSQALEGFSAMGIPTCPTCKFDGHYEGCELGETVFVDETGEYTGTPED